MQSITRKSLFEDNRVNKMLALQTKYEDAKKRASQTHEQHVEYYDTVIHAIVHRGMESLDTLNRVSWDKVVRLFYTIPEKDKHDLKLHGFAI